MKLKNGIDTKIKNFTYIDAETIITPFFTSEYCDFLIKTFEDYGWTVDGQGNFDTYLHLVKEGKKICKDFLEVIKEEIEPEIVKNWTEAIKGRLWKYYPVPFVKKFSLKGQTELKLHVDNSLITFLVKLTGS